MKVRFKLLKPYSTTPTLTCGNKGLDVGTSGVSMGLVIDGTSIINTADVSSLSFPTAPIVTSQGFSVTVSKDFYGSDTEVYSGGANYYTIDITGTEIGSYFTMDVGIVEPSGGAFNNTFTLFGYDLGNNYHVGITANPPMDISMKRFTGGPYPAIAAFTAYREPFTNNVHIYSLTNGPTVTYTDIGGNVLTSNPSDIITVSGQGKNSYAILGNFSGTVDCTTQVNVQGHVWLPTFTFDYTFPNGGSINEGTLVSAKVLIDHTEMSTLEVDDVTVYPIDSQVFTYNIRDFTYTPIIIHTSATLSVFVGMTYNPITYGYINFTIPPGVHYAVEVDISSFGSIGGLVDFTTLAATLDVLPTALMIQEKDCGIEVVNTTGGNETISVYKYTTKSVKELVSTHVIGAGATLQIELTKDGVYSVDYLGSNVFLYARDCDFQACLLTLTNNLICGKLKECDVAYYNSLMATYLAYTAKLDADFNLGTGFAVLDSNKLSTIFTLSKYIDKLGSYCTTINNDCGCASGC